MTKRKNETLGHVHELVLRAVSAAEGQSTQELHARLRRVDGSMDLAWLHRLLRGLERAQLIAQSKTGIRPHRFNVTPAGTAKLDAWAINRVTVVTDVPPPTASE